MMAQSHSKRCEQVRAKWDKASKAFCDWAIANDYGHIRRNELEAALVGVSEGERLLAADRDARTALDAAENAAVADGHAWRGSYGMVSFYSSADIRRFAARRRRFAS